MFTISFGSVCNYYSALTNLSNLTVARQLHDVYNWFDLERETKAERCARFGIQGVDSDYIPSQTFISKFDRLYPFNDKHYFIIIGNYECYRFSSFAEFLMESQSPLFVDEVVQKEMRMWVFKHSERVLSAVVKMAMTLESVTCYGFSKKLSDALCHKQHLKKFVVFMFSNTTVAYDFQGILNVLQTCPNLKDVTIRVRFLESVADIAASKLADALLHTSLERCTIDALNTIQDDGVSALAPALSRIPRVVARFISQSFKTCRSV